LTFIVARPGNTLLRIAMSKIQPLRTKRPMRMTDALAACEMNSKEEELKGDWPDRSVTVDSRFCFGNLNCNARLAVLIKLLLSL
jgi:hypothetical protein